jgi:hypothetical protein
MTKNMPAQSVIPCLAWHRFVLAILNRISAHPRSACFATLIASRALLQEMLIHVSTVESGLIMVV